jgi:hypothetical protein
MRFHAKKKQHKKDTPINVNGRLPSKQCCLPRAQQGRYQPSPWQLLAKRRVHSPATEQRRAARVRRPDLVSEPWFWSPPPLGEKKTQIGRRTPTRRIVCPCDLLMVMAHASFNGNWRRVKRMAMSPVESNTQCHKKNYLALSFDLSGALKVDAGQVDDLACHWSAARANCNRVPAQLRNDASGAVHQPCLARQVSDAN